MSEPTRSIIIIDDDPTQAMLIQRVLKDGPYSFTVCNDAESALALIDNRASFDLIISDFMLPGISGLQAVEHIRHSRIAKNTPIIMISAHGGGYEIRERALSAGADIFISKPLTAGELRRAVDALLGPPPVESA